MQKEDQLQSGTQGLDYGVEYINKTDTVTRSSEINEEFHMIRAIEEDGLPVEITGVTVDTSYQADVAFNSDRGRIRTAHSEEFDSITEDYFSKFDDATVFYFSTEILADISLYYTTPFDQVYRTTFTQERRRSKFTPSRYDISIRKFLKCLLDTVACSDRADTVSDICDLNPVKATIYPDEDLTEGVIKIDDQEVTLNQCEKVDFSRNGSEKVENHIRLITKSEYNKRSEANRRYLSDWLHGYISDVRGDASDNTVVLTVETPLGTAVFPYSLQHDTESTFWHLVNESGGDLADLRGMEVCVRRRGSYNLVYSKYDIRDTGFSHHEYPEFNSKTMNQPIPTPNDRGHQLVIDGPSNVDPVGVSSDYAWVLGIPCSNEETDHTEHNSEDKKKTDKKENPDKNGLIGKINSLL